LKYQTTPKQKVGLIMVQTELKLLDMLLSEGSLDILAFLKDKKTGQFTDLLKLKNKRTNRGFSPTTISARLDELETIGAITTTAVKTKRRRVLGYQITEKGLKILDTAFEFEGKLKEIVDIEEVKPKK